MQQIDKPRSDSKLKTLPEERQDEIADYAADHSLADTVNWLASGGMYISSTALARFLAWQRTKQQMQRNELAITQLLADLPARNPELTGDRIRELGHLFFASLAIEKQDPKAWYLAQQIYLHKDQVDLALRKYQDQMQERKEAIQRQLDVAKKGGGLSPETIEKIEQELHLF